VSGQSTHDKSEREQVWSQVAAQLASFVDDEAYRIWLKPLCAVELSQDRLLVQAPTHAYAWIRERYGDLIQTAVELVLGPRITVEFTHGGTESYLGDTSRHSQARAQTPQFPRPSPLLGAVSNPKMTFDQFAIGDSNRLAHAAALTVAEMPAEAYNPLLVCVPPGVGKTHLLVSIANHLISRDPGIVVRMTTGEAFTNALLSATMAGTVDAFKLYFRDVNVLLVDDIQFLEQKPRTQQEFLHTFVAIHDAGCQIVLSSDRPPHDLHFLEERLRARMEAGLVADVHPPDLPTRLAILRMRVERDRIDFADESALSLIADRIHGNVRTLEGALIRVVAFGSLCGRPLTVALAREVLDGLYPYPPATERELTVEEIQDAVSREFGLTRDDLLAVGRSARVAWPRQVAMFLARELTDESLPALGRQFGNRDHTTVLHAWRRAQARMASDDESCATIERLRRSLEHDDSVRAVQAGTADGR
jgi:chromosomal replication initiator protein